MTASMMPVMVTTVDIDPDDPDRIAVGCDFRLKDLVKVLPGSRWNPTTRRWTVPLTWPSCLALRAQFGSALSIGDPLKMWASGAGDIKKRLRAMRNDLVSDPSEEFPVPGLFGYQEVGALAIYLAEQYLLFDATGTGKSRTALSGLYLLQKDDDDIFPLLIVAPKSMLQTWARTEVPEIFPHATVSVVAGTPKQVETALTPGHDVYVTSYDMLRRHSRLSPFGSVTLTDKEKQPGLFQNIAFRSVIADEAHRAKNAQAKQTRALWYVGHRAKYRIALTGTPIQDTPEDMWSLLHFVAPDEYPSKTAYVDRFLRVDYNIWGGREILGLNPRTEEEFRANLEARFRRITKDVALPFLPPKVFEIRWVEMPPPLRRAYRTMVSDMVAKLSDGSVLEVDSVLARATRLTQLANSSGEIEIDADGNEIFRMALPSPKIDQFMEDIDSGDYEGQKVAVYSDSRQLLELLSQTMTKKGLTYVMIHGDVTGVDRQEAIETFQAGDVDFILLTRAGGEGITLTAASVMVRLMRSWSYIAHTQSEDRVHRIGSEIHSSITYVDYVVSDTIEEGQLVRLSGKGERAQEVLRDADLLDLIKS